MSDCLRVSCSKLPRAVRRHVFWTGGGGGAAATKRQRQEQFILDGLQKLLAGLDQVGETSPAPTRGRSPTARASEAAASVSSPGWQTVEGKGKGKSKGKGKGKCVGRAGSQELREPSPRRVCFQEEAPDTNQPLLAQLKALVLQAKTHGTATQVSGLQNLLKKHTPQQRARSPVVVQAAKTQPEKKTFQTKWWKGILVSVTKLAEAVLQRPQVVMLLSLLLQRPKSSVQLLRCTVTASHLL